MKRVLIGVGVALALQAQVRAALPPPIMAIYAVKADADGVSVRLPPVGLARCTPSRALLTVAIDKRPGAAILLIAPRGAPECRAAGQAGEVRWTYEELGLKAGEPFELGNPLQAEPKPGPAD